jgi:hypothetical protein
MAKFPVDAPLDRVLRTLQLLEFKMVRSGNHIALARTEPDGSVTPLTLPGHRIIKGSTLRTILTQSRIPRDEFISAYDRS